MPATHAHTPQPFLAEAQRIVAEQQRVRDAHYTGGVSWSALDRRVPEVADVEAVRLQLVAAHERAEAYAASPRGRAHAAAVELQNLGYGDDLRPAAVVLYACERGAPEWRLAADLSPENLLRAIRVLGAIKHSLAREAVLALTEIGAPVVQSEAA